MGLFMVYKPAHNGLVTLLRISKTYKLCIKIHKLIFIHAQSALENTTEMFVYRFEPVSSVMSSVTPAYGQRMTCVIDFV